MYGYLIYFYLTQLVYSGLHGSSYSGIVDKQVLIKSGTLLNALLTIGICKNY